MSNNKKKIEKLFKDNFINEKSKITHQKIVEKVDSQKKKLAKEVDEKRKNNNKEISQLAKGLVFQIGNIEVQT